MIKPKAFTLKSLVAIAAALGLWTSAAQAQENLKIGLIATLSGPPAVLGQQLRNGFTLAVKTLGGKLGGRDGRDRRCRRRAEARRRRRQGQGVHRAR